MGTKRLLRIIRLVLDAPRGVEDVFAEASRIATQEMLADATTRHLLALSGAALLRFSASTACDASVARRLLQHLEEAAGEISIDRFLDLATAAVMIVDRLPQCAALRVRAWQKRGSACARKGLFNDADQCFDRAENLVAGTAAADYYLALVTLGRAVAWYLGQRSDRAAQALIGLAEIFELHCDARRAAYARQLHAMVLQNFDQLEEALCQYRAIEPYIVATGSRFDVAILRKNIATCLLDLGKLDDAREYLQGALPVLRAAGQLDAVARVERKFARVEGSPALLVSVAETFLEAGAIGEFVLTYLDVVHAKLSMDPTANVVADCRRLLVEAITCGLERHVTARLVELEAMAARQVITTTDVATLQRFVEPRAAELRISQN